MSFGGDIVTAGVVSIIAIVLQRIMVGFLDPNRALFEVAAGAGNLNGAARAWLWAQIGVVWIPIIAVVAIWAWVGIRLFKRQVATGAGGARRAP